MSWRAYSGILLSILLVAWGCSDLKKDAIGPSPQPSSALTFQAHIQPIFQQNCVSCHSGGGAEGRYDLSSLSGVFGSGTDATPNVIPGSADSRLLVVIQAGAHAGYVGTPANAAALTKWVVDDRMGMVQPDAHPSGWMSPGSPGFHGRTVEAAHWNMGSCRGCHGADYKGGITGSSCVVCHSETPEGCSTCHGSGASPAPPGDLVGSFDTAERGVGSHQAHLAGGTLSNGFACTECHAVPQALHDAGHVDTGLPAEVTFGTLAKTDGATPEWGGTTCTNSYCHGAAEPRWTESGTGEAACGTCHGLPPDTPTHPKVSACDLCHGEVVDADGKIADPSLHVNGQVEVSFGHPDGFANPSSENFHTVAIRDAGWDLASCRSCHGADYAGGTVEETCLTCHPKTPEDCSTCHGGIANPAPPEDLAGNVATTFRGVGAHQAHLTESVTSRALTCVECHVMPEALDDTGHIGSGLPAEVTFGALARGEEGTPTWDGTTCATVYCHGAFEEESRTSIKWTEVGTGQAACGTCHGTPPGDDHPDNKNCSWCHPRVADDDLNILDKSLHMNGEVDMGG